MDGEFNLSNTIGIGLNIGEQLLLPVANGEDDVLQQHHHHQLQSEPDGYTTTLHVEHQSMELTPTDPNVNNNPTNVSCMENFYPEVSIFFKL